MSARLLAACGQKGPLILPDDAKGPEAEKAKPAQGSSNKPVSAKPAAETQLSTEPTSTKPDNIE